MANIRIISDNAADRASLLVSSQAGALGAAALKTDDKTDIWRSVGTAASLNLGWPALETVSGIHWPFTNWSPAATLRVRGRAEPAALNLLLYSEQFNVAPWSTKEGIIVPNARAAPDGTQTMDKLVMNTKANSSHSVLQNTPADTPYPAYTTVTFSVYAAAGELTQLYLQCSAPGASPMPAAHFDLLSGAVSLVEANVTARAVSVGNGVWRCIITTTTPEWDDFIRCRILLSSPNGTASVTNPGRAVFATGDGTSGVYLWGAQLVLGPDPWPYSQTTSTPGSQPVWLFDTGEVPACPAPSPAVWGWNGITQGVNSFAYGGAVHARLWLPQPTAVRALQIDIADPGNPQGYLEAARLIIGNHWSPENNADDAPITSVDTSTPGRTEAGSRFTKRGTLHNEMSVNFPWLTEQDRATLWAMLRTHGLSKPMLVSLFPNDPSSAREQANQIYGALMSMPPMETPDSGAGRYTCKFNLEEI